MLISRDEKYEQLIVYEYCILERHPLVNIEYENFTLSIEGYDFHSCS